LHLARQGARLRARLGVFAMEAEEILAQARAGTDHPQGWIVFPLLRNKVMLGIAGWAFGIVMGFGLFAAVASVVIPSNYEHGVAGALFTTVMLAVLLFIGIGSGITLIGDVNRLRNAAKYLIVITPNDFVKQEGSKIIHVPLVYVRYVTARGTPPPDRSTGNNKGMGDIPGAGENVAGFFFGRGLLPSGQNWRRKRMRTPTSLAFLDIRTEREVTVTNDNAYGDPFLIAAYLKQYATSAQQLV
jgi:hypothetical protein